MKMKRRSLTSLLSAAFLLSAAMAPTGFALADFGQAMGYHVDPGRNTDNPQHDNATYLVFQTSPAPDKKFGILFMQTQGSFPYKPFMCLNGEWTPQTQSTSCSIIMGEIPGLQILETVTVGKLTGHFCSGLRNKHNPEAGDGTDPIMKPSECPGAGKCSCYEVAHYCRFKESDEWDEGACPDLAQVYSGGLRTTEGRVDIGSAPPGRGAGSGGSN